MNNLFINFWCLCIIALIMDEWMSGPGIAESNNSEYRLHFLVWFFIWLIGFALHFRRNIER